MAEPRRPFGVKVLIGMVTFLGIAGVPSGLLLMIRPDGSLLQLPQNMLDKLPVGDWFLIGLFLFAIFGIYSWVLVYGLLTRRKWAWTASIEKLFGHHWSWAGCVVLGAILLAWTGIEVVLFGLPALTIVFLVYGFIVVGLAGLKSSREFFAINPI